MDGCRLLIVVILLPLRRLSGCACRRKRTYLFCFSGGLSCVPVYRSAEPKAASASGAIQSPEEVYDETNLAELKEEEIYVSGYEVIKLLGLRIKLIDISLSLSHRSTFNCPKKLI